MNRLSHEQRVQAVARSVKACAATHRPGEYFSLHKAAVSHLIPKPGDPKHGDRKVSIVGLSEILEIDPERNTCVAEPGVTFDALCRETLKHRLLPMIVPELRTITVGGAVAGGAVESASFRYGLFHDTCLEYELVTGTGQIIRCSARQNADIFDMVHSSFGTLGILTALRFRLRPASPYVRVEYLRFATLDAFMRAVQKYAGSQLPDFMDGIVHAPKELVLCLGRFVEEAPYLSRYSWKVYYRSTRNRDTDYLRTRDYLFRYDRESFWISRNYGLENPILRFLSLPIASGSTRMLSLARRLPFLVGGQPDVAADVLLPRGKLKAFLDWYLEVFDYFPLWILPTRIRRMYPWINPDFMRSAGDDLFMECGIYGFRQDGRRDYYRALEEKVVELRGVKALIGYNYYDEKTFWRTFDRKRYQRVKRITDPQNLFRDIYAKTCPDAATPTGPASRRVSR